MACLEARGLVENVGNDLLVELGASAVFDEAIIPVIREFRQINRDRIVDGEFLV